MSDEQNTPGDAVTPDAPETTTTHAETATLTVERVADTALGALIAAAEALETAMKLLQEHGPAVAEAWESKGRPVRERILESLRGTPFAVPTTAEPSPAETAPPPTDASAAEEITALERRVRELESQIAGSDAKPAPTPAEEATFNGEIWENEAERESLSDSPYAISETPEERQREAENNGA